MLPKYLKKINFHSTDYYTTRNEIFSHKNLRPESQKLNSVLQWLHKLDHFFSKLLMRWWETFENWDKLLLLKFWVKFKSQMYMCTWKHVSRNKWAIDLKNHFFKQLKKISRKLPSLKSKGKRTRSSSYAPTNDIDYCMIKSEFVAKRLIKRTGFDVFHAKYQVSWKFYLKSCETGAE